MRRKGVVKTSPCKPYEAFCLVLPQLLRCVLGNLALGNNNTAAARTSSGRVASVPATSLGN
ncbi:hypothetical protein ASU33_04915 [Solirubrum puertoriconensis]|uniref:Uncharacterized protein n=1 Tax=Solirubrum puertoriconensis TaxID=1751427 RepID=A0A9X0L3N4_SOLP1|nr:hypothetical protein ASU33_04915 [Solirubrum puertoriconensis]